MTQPVRRSDSASRSPDSPSVLAELEQVYIQAQQEPISYYEAVISAVVFDWNGMPQEYFMTPSLDLAWEKAVFQTLGLRWLLMSFLSLEGFQHSKLSGSAHTIHIIRQQECYMALLLERCDRRDLQPAFLEWLWAFDVSRLRNDPRFQA